MNHLKKIKSFFKFEDPGPLTMDGWEELDTHRKEQFPIKYFFIETIPETFNNLIGYNLHKLLVDKIYWGFKYRFIKKHQYNIIRPTTLKPGYHNEYDLILHSVFHILTEFIEYNKKEDLINWESDKPHSNFWKEANELYNWWINVHPYRYDKLEIEYPDPDGPSGSNCSWILSNKYNDTSEYKEWIKIANIRRIKENEFKQEDETNLIRLMKIRMFLWT